MLHLTTLVCYDLNNLLLNKLLSCIYDFYKVYSLRDQNTGIYIFPLKKSENCYLHEQAPATFLIFAGCDWAGSPVWRFEACHGLAGVSATQQEGDKKVVFGGRRRKKSQHIKNKSTEGSSGSSLSRPRRLTGQRSETAGRTYLVPITLVHRRRLPKPIAPHQKTHIQAMREESQFKVTQDNNNWLSRCLGFCICSFHFLAEFLMVRPFFFFLVKTHLTVV